VLPGREAIEPLKWLGVSAMLLEHWMRYAVGHLPDWAYAAGRLAFPLFVFALALATRDLPSARLPAIILRMLAWAIVAQLALLTVDAPAGQANILATFALGMTAAWLLESGLPLLLQAVALAAIGTAALWCEFGVVGVAFVAVTVKVARAGEAPLAAWLAVVVMLFALALPNRNHFALAAAPLAYAVGRSGIRVPRLRRAFYWIYVLQFPVFAAARSLAT
jgi:hypothetical protein